MASGDIKRIGPIHRAVARSLARGFSLEKTLSEFGIMNVSRWKTIVSSPFFQMEVKRFEALLEEEILKEESTDPIWVKLKDAREKAVERVSAEVDNDDPEQGANASTRLKASFGILDRTGYGVKSTQEAAQTAITINLISGQFEKVFSPRALQVQPDSIRGEAGLLQLTG